MTRFEFNIYPNLKKQIIICKARIFVSNIVLFESVTVDVQLFNELDSVIDTRQYIIEGAEYNAWSNNDQYLIDLVKKKLQE